MWPFNRDKKPKVEPPPPPPRKLNVERVVATVTENDDTTHEQVFEGWWRVGELLDHDHDFVFTGWELFSDWQLDAGSKGMIAVGNGKFIPMCRVRSVDAVIHELWVEARTKNR